MYVSIIYTLCRHGAPMDLLDLCLPWACQVQHVAYVVGGRVGMELITMTRFPEGSTPPPTLPNPYFLLIYTPLPPRIVRIDGKPMGIAILWSVWKNPESDKELHSFASLTINADQQDFMKHYHTPQDEKFMIAILMLMNTSSTERSTTK